MTVLEENYMKPSLKNSWLIRIKRLNKRKSFIILKERTLIDILRDQILQQSLAKDFLKRAIKVYRGLMTKIL